MEEDFGQFNNKLWATINAFLVLTLQYFDNVVYRWQEGYLTGKKCCSNNSDNFTPGPQHKCTTFSIYQKIGCLNKKTKSNTLEVIVLLAR